MTQFDKNQFLARLPLLQFLKNQQVCWSDLELGIREFTLQSGDKHGRLSSPLHNWWHTCFDLLASRQLHIHHINYQASELGQDEFVEVLNLGPAILDISGYRINAGDKGQDMVFPSGTTILPNQVIRVYTRDLGEHSFHAKQSIWNNRGDTGYLFDPLGHLTSAWAYGSDVHSEINISRIHFDGAELHSEGDEYIELSNMGACWLDISKWRILSQGEQEFTFPVGAHIQPYGNIRVHTNEIHLDTGGYSFQSKKAIWNNNGDTGKLLDETGKLIAEMSY